MTWWIPLPVLFLLDRQDRQWAQEKPPFHVTGCTGKKHFTRFALARAAAKRSNRHDHGRHLEAYHCRHCNGFHVGESRQDKRADKRKRSTKEPDHA